MAHRDVVVIGTSAGGLEALQKILSTLPPDLNAAVLIVLHTSKHSGSLLPTVLGRACRLPVSHPRDGEAIQPGHVYIASPGCHMILEDGLIRVLPGPRENLHCPAIDPLFRSAAMVYGPRVIGLILTGMMDDGTSGLMIVAANGGEAIVEDPASALFSSMPKSALQQVPNARVVPLAQIGVTLLELIRQELRSRPNISKKELAEVGKEIRIAELDMSEISKDDHPGKPSSFACPDCGGVLWEIDQDHFLRFRCRVGHAFTARFLAAEQRQSIDSALWAALRALEESCSLYRRMADRAKKSHMNLAADSYEERASATDANSRVLREFLLQLNTREIVDDPGDLEQAENTTHVRGRTEKAG